MELLLWIVIFSEKKLCTLCLPFHDCLCKHFAILVCRFLCNLAHLCSSTHLVHRFWKASYDHVNNSNDGIIGSSMPRRYHKHDHIQNRSLIDVVGRHPVWTGLTWELHFPVCCDLLLIFRREHAFQKRCLIKWLNHKGERGSIIPHNPALKLLNDGESQRPQSPEISTCSCYIFCRPPRSLYTPYQHRNQKTGWNHCFGCKSCNGKLIRLWFGILNIAGTKPWAHNWWEVLCIPQCFVLLFQLWQDLPKIVHPFLRRIRSVDQLRGWDSSPMDLDLFRGRLIREHAFHFHIVDEQLALASKKKSKTRPQECTNSSSCLSSNIISWVHRCSDFSLIMNHSSHWWKGRSLTLHPGVLETLDAQKCWHWSRLRYWKECIMWSVWYIYIQATFLPVSNAVSIYWAQQVFCDCDLSCLYVCIYMAYQELISINDLNKS